MLDIPTIGVSKQLMCTDGLCPELVKRKLAHAKFQVVAGKRVKITRLFSTISGKILGAAVLQEGLKKPVYVSIGHRVDLEMAIKIAVAVSKYRVPEPIRQADIRGRKVVREYQDCSKQQKQSVSIEMRSAASYPTM